VLSYPRLIGILVGSFLMLVDARFLIIQPGSSAVLSARRLVQHAQTLDLGGVGPYHRQLDVWVQVAGGPAAPDPGIEGDLGHDQVLGQITQPPFVLGQGRAVGPGGDAGALDARSPQQVADRVGGEGLAAPGRAEALRVEAVGDLRGGQPGIC